jgi:hypothetical protein
LLARQDVFQRAFASAPDNSPMILVCTIEGLTMYAGRI